jgi:hypothetical protein
MRPGSGIYIVPLQGSEQERAPKPLAEKGEVSQRASFSPDGQWIVYEVYPPLRGRAGYVGAYVQPFPGPGLRKQIAADYSGIPVWRKDGKEIVIAQVQGVWSISVDAKGGGLHFGSPELLFPAVRFPSGYNGSSRPLAVSRDGSRIFWVQGMEQPEANVINVRIGWESK